MSDHTGSPHRIEFLAALVFLNLSPFFVLLVNAAPPEREVPAAVITEIRWGHGRTEVKSLGSGEWSEARPLKVLRAGDEVRVSEDTVLFLLLSDGRGRHLVTATNSPYIVTAPIPENGTTRKLLALLQRSLSFLLASSKDSPDGTLGSRGGPGAPVILSAGLVLPASLLFEWQERNPSQYTVSITGPGGVLWQQDRVSGGSLEYPSSNAPVLEPGIKYTFRVRPNRGRSDEAYFEVLDATRAELVRQDVAYLRLELAPLVADGALVAIEASYLADHALLHDARLVLVEALKVHPEEPGFHLLLAELYTRMGLPEQAAESRREARALLARKH